jgi:hypothetical protein
VAKEYGDSWDRKCWGEISGDGKVVTLLAYEKEERKRLPPSYLKAAIRALVADGFKKVDLDRLHENPINHSHTINEKGQIMGQHKSLHSQLGSKDAQGNWKLDSTTVNNIVTKYGEAVVTGKMKIEGISEIDLGNGKYARTFIMQE